MKRAHYVHYRRSSAEWPTTRWWLTAPAGRCYRVPDLLELVALVPERRDEASGTSPVGAVECKADYAFYVKLFMPDTIQVTSFIFIYIQY